ncbi:MAG: beta-ketoacyl synthase chain length factor [gamma proteobacterium symbiont of Lucinoma myriamae]|nr:beta-ketoacyl synthase chain length factor [gamma proteobacterium symbiont of Lucinoma myriamae]
MGYDYRPFSTDFYRIKVFTQTKHYSPAPVDNKLATILPPNERRRAARVTQLAIYAAQQTDTPELNNSSLNQCLQVFSSANGDITTFHQISQALAMDGRPVSTTRFHNSVHNAPAGYWSIASQSKTPSTSITAYFDSFSTGLLEAAVQLNASDNQQHRDCLLVCYDEIPAEPFQQHLHITAEFACALRLSLSSNNALACMDIQIGHQAQPITSLSDPAIDHLRQANPQAAALPLLDAIARQDKKKYYYLILNKV